MSIVIAFDWEIISIMFSMSFSTDGADFYDNDELIVDILNDVGNCVNDGVGNGNIFDPHGTIIGSWELD